jgi:hypothetical protein
MERKILHRMCSALVCCLLIGLTGCIDQNVGEDMGRKATDGKVTLKTYADILIGTDEFLFGCSGTVFCLDWDGNLVWQTESFGSNALALCGDHLFANVSTKISGKGGVVLLGLSGEVLWKKEIGMILSVAVGGSSELLAAGTHDTGIVWAFSKEGEVLWTYDDGESIEQVIVAPDGSCVVFTDFEDRINCVRDGELIWSKNAGSIYTGLSNRTVAFSPDSSYLAYRFVGGGPQINVSTLDGEDIWSYPLEDRLTSVIITSDSQYIIAACSKHLYKFTRDGKLVWKNPLGRDNRYLASTPGAEYIVLGCVTLFSFIVVVDGDGNTLWRDQSFDNVFAVAISPDGNHVAYVDQGGKLRIFSNPRE